MAYVINGFPSKIARFFCLSLSLPKRARAAGLFPIAVRKVGVRLE